MARAPYRSVLLFGCLAVAVFQVGCAGAHTTIRAARAKHPISFSGGVPDSSGRVLVVDQDLKKVGEFSESYWRWSVLYDSIHSDVDVSEEVNEAVKQNGGEAIANFSVTSTECFLDWMVPFTILPFWPGCAIVDISGDVVVRKPESARRPATGVKRAGEKQPAMKREADGIEQ